jgi:nucleotide-binding universal stress UspA family protein
VFKRILVAFDGTENATKAFDRSLRLGSSLASEFAVVAVVCSSDFALESNARAIQEDAETQFKGAFRVLQRRARMAGIEPELMLRVGDPVEQILKVAAEWHADLIVTGRRRNGLLARLSFSVSRQVVTQARCPVLIMC